jgi:hypothetical protein
MSNPSTGETSQHNFLSSLVQLTSTILGIFLAAVTAYYVFLEDKTAQFADQIQANKLEIRDTLRNLAISWPQGLAMYLPVEFREEYRREYPEKTGADFVEQAARDVLFLNAPLKRAMDRVRGNDSFGGPWHGRAYFWVLDEAVGSLTLASRYTGSSPDNVFPWSLDGPGFEQWRPGFEKVRGMLTLLGDYQPAMLLDFQQFVSGLPTQYKAMNLPKHYQSGAENFYDKLKLVGSKLDEIDKATLSAKRYSFREKVQLSKILVLCFFSVVAGILIPQTLLAGRCDSATFGKVLFLISAISLGGASLQFAQDIAKPVSIDWSSYITVRWYEPILKQARQQQPGLGNGGMINAEYCMGAINSEENKFFDREIIDALKLYVVRVDSYNKEAKVFNALALETMRRDKVIQDSSANFRSLKGGPVLYPYYLIDDRKWNEFRESLIRSVVGDVSVEVLGPSWTKIEIQIPGPLFTHESSKALKSLEEVRNSLRLEPQAREFLKARDLMAMASDHLIEVLARQTMRKS